jgi:DNA-binding LytR/AlgR family response regulator
MKVLIVEDELLVSDYINNIITKYDYNVVGMVDNIAEAKKNIEYNTPDVVLLDIRLVNNENGIDLGRYLSSHKIPFVYITANSDIDTIKKAAETKPFSYLSKPFNERDIVAAFEVIKASLKSEKLLEIKTPNGKVQINVNDIYFIKADNVYVEIQTIDKSYTERLTLKEMEEEINSPDFIRVHRSYLVNKKHIASWTSQAVCLTNSINISISKTYRKVFRDNIK